MIDKPEGEDKNEYEDEDGKRDDSEKVIRADKKIVGEKLPPGWEKHEGKLLHVPTFIRHAFYFGTLNFYADGVSFSFVVVCCSFR